MVAAVGVNTTDCAFVPRGGMVAGAAKVNPPGTEAVPPLRMELLKACPSLMALAVGQVVTLGVAWLTVSVWLALAAAA